MAQKFLTKVTPWDNGGEAGKVQFILGNGLKVVADLAEMPEGVVQQLAIHGLSQKVGDSAAGYSKGLEYSNAFGAMQGVVDNLTQGIWASRTGAGTSDFVQALCNIKGMELADAQELVDRMSEEQMAQVKKHPQIKLEMARIKEARLAAAVSEDKGGLDKMLEDIGL